MGYILQFSQILFAIVLSVKAHVHPRGEQKKNSKIKGRLRCVCFYSKDKKEINTYYIYTIICEVFFSHSSFHVESYSVNIIISLINKIYKLVKK